MGGGPGSWMFTQSPPWGDAQDHLAATLEGLGKGTPLGWLSPRSAGSGCACVHAEPGGSAGRPLQAGLAPLLRAQTALKGITFS